MPPASEPIFDRTLRRNQLRRARHGLAPDFLMSRAVDEILDRLALTRRAFQTIADIGTPVPALARAIAAEHRTLVRMAPLPEPAAGPWLSLVGDEEALPLRGTGFDLALSALSLHHVNDLPGALLQIRRILLPDGLFLGCLLGGRSLVELRTALNVAETDMFGGVSPRVAPFADVRDMGALLQRAGFALPVVDNDTLTVRYPDLFALMADLRAMGATNVLAARRRQPTPRRLMLRAADVYAERFADADGRVRATFEIIFLSGWAPHESQQKPLPRGSARMRLADALAAIPHDKKES